MTILLTVLISGCAKITNDSYCDISSPMYFGHEDVVDMIMNEDRQLLTDILVHNETHFCLLYTSDAADE